MRSTLKWGVRLAVEYLQKASLRAALKEQGLWELYARLGEIVPDLKSQYSSFEVDSDYLLLNVRGVHAFQVALVNEAICEASEPTRPLLVVDVGDSAGSHIQYLEALHKGRELKCMSVNLDEMAIRKIQAKGLQAVHARAEELTRRGINADVFISFEMLEHLPNPVHFLRDLSYHTTCRALVVTVPYVKKSRVGLHQIRNNLRKPHNAENTHLFELSPADWRLLFKHAGWSIVRERVYWQYPKRSSLCFMKSTWKYLDYEGFWGAILARDHSWSDLYTG